MLTIRLQRIGKKHQPSFRVVVAERRSKLGGPPVEDLGSYEPRTKKVTVEKERVLHWLKTGVKASPTVHNLLVKGGVVSGPKITIKIRKQAAAEVAPMTHTTQSEIAPVAPTETATIEASE